MLFGAEPLGVQRVGRPRSRHRRRHRDQRDPRRSRPGSRRSPARPASRPDQRVHVYGTDGRISIEIPFNIPPDRPTRIFVTAGGDPPVAPATETLTFETADPYTVEAERFAAAILDGTADADATGGRGRQPAGDRRDLRGRLRRRVLTVLGILPPGGADQAVTRCAQRSTGSPRCRPVDVPSPPTGPDGDRVTSRRIAVVAVLVIAVDRRGRRRLGRVRRSARGDIRVLRSGRRTSSTRRHRPGSHVTYDGPYPYAVGGGVAVLDCDGDGRPDLYLAGGASPAVLYRNDSAGRRRAPVHGRPRSGDGPDRRVRRLPARHRRRRDRSTSPCCATGEQRAPARARRLSVRARQRGARVRRRRRG